MRSQDGAQVTPSKLLNLRGVGMNNHTLFGWSGACSGPAFHPFNLYNAQLAAFEFLIESGALDKFVSPVNRLSRFYPRSGR